MNISGTFNLASTCSFASMEAISSQVELSTEGFFPQRAVYVNGMNGAYYGDEYPPAVVGASPLCQWLMCGFCLYFILHGAKRA